MINLLPRWVELGAFLLALIAGAVNAVALLGFEHQSVSHVSGSATLMGLAIATADLPGQLKLVGVLVTFFLGAAIAGLLIENTALKLGRHYETVLVLEAIFLIVACGLLVKGVVWGHLFASAACGLQNAMATAYSGAVIRTTHLTGIFTDLGFMLGAWLRGDKPDRRKVLLFLFVIVGFIIGAVLGGLTYSHIGYFALLMPACVCLFLAVCYRGYLVYLRHGKR
ncbi:YoaK family protein [Simiduia agarivorans]|uniref:Transmembrane protein n=1 Tax=Simiduia agarivorans (strain DSM 21679 / JCM 13881 / BCRC 17597 / SA1) TaxID=1117647 RepID=K4KMV8_SIMAS|nr:YoaK family protein [Simiduia agarivorans]AFV00357.1 hypothetical protein M5M_16120 [Simiduia agarivorans SA1 = DSM 21679]